MFACKLIKTVLGSRHDSMHQNEITNTFTIVLKRARNCTIPVEQEVEGLLSPFSPTLIQLGTSFKTAFQVKEVQTTSPFSWTQDITSHDQCSFWDILRIHWAILFLLGFRCLGPSDAKQRHVHRKCHRWDGKYARPI